MHIERSKILTLKLEYNHDKIGFYPLLTLFATGFVGVKSCEDHTVVRFS